MSPSRKVPSAALASLLPSPLRDLSMTRHVGRPLRMARPSSSPTRSANSECVSERRPLRIGASVMFTTSAAGPMRISSPGLTRVRSEMAVPLISVVACGLAGAITTCSPVQISVAWCASTIGGTSMRMSELAPLPTLNS
jgi:hypothetical protein